MKEWPGQVYWNYNLEVTPPPPPPTPYVNEVHTHSGSKLDKNETVLPFEGPTFLLPLAAAQKKIIFFKIFIYREFWLTNVVYRVYYTEV